jgi:hypothetical protein
MPTNQGRTLEFVRARQFTPLGKGDADCPEYDIRTENSADLQVVPLMQDAVQLSWALAAGSAALGPVPEQSRCLIDRRPLSAELVPARRPADDAHFSG